MTALKALANGCNRNLERGDMTAYRVEVVNVPPNYMIELGLATVTRETRVIHGYTLADAKRRAGIS